MTSKATSKVEKVKKVKQKRSKTGKSMKNLGKLAGSTIGGALMGPGGAMIGGMVGRSAGKLISKITGFGDYRVNRNSLVTGNTVPTFASTSDGVVICHREFIANVVGSVEFKLTSYAINPGLGPTFPLVSQMSTTFEEYEMVGLVFEYRPSSGSAISSASSALGTVILATDYDATNPRFVNKQQMESYEFSTSTVPFTGCMHPVECMRGRNVLDNLYVRHSAVTPGDDIRFFDMGNFQIATEGMQSAYTVGELWVSYDIRLRKPRLTPTSQLNTSPYIRVCTYPYNSSTNANLFGSAPTQSAHVDPDSSSEFYDFVTGSNFYKVTFRRAGTYGLFFFIKGTIDGTTPGFSGESGANVTFTPQYLQCDTEGTDTVNFTNTSTFSTFQLMTITADGDGNPNGYQITSVGATWAEPSNADLMVWRISGVALPLLPFTAPSNLRPSTKFIIGGPTPIAMRGRRDSFDEKDGVMVLPALNSTSLK